MIAGVATELQREAERANERRVLVFAGDCDRGVDAAYDAIEATGVADESVTIVSTREGFRFERMSPRGTDAILGRTRDIVVLDCHEQFVPNALGRAVGAVDGGGLLVLLTPDLDDWPAVRDDFDDSLAVPPFSLDDVTGRFRERLVGTLRTHPGVALVRLPNGSGVSAPSSPSDAPGPAAERDGLTDPPSPEPRSTPTRPPDATFPHAAYDACLTGDQSRALAALEALASPGSAVVVEADRGRGKSSAAGLAAGSLALAGYDVLVTAPAFRNAAELFARARDLVSTVSPDASVDPDTKEPSSSGSDQEPDRVVHAPGSGRVRFAPPAVASGLPEAPDCVLVDEAAALPLRLLERFLAAPAVSFSTTVHGYEGAGRGFSVRFRDRLLDSEFSVRDVRLDEPIRYAAGDPVESWAARALLLDARPPVPEAVAGTTVTDVQYRRLDPDGLVADEVLLREAFGLLVTAHYRTEPNDLARLLDAPNLEARALTADGRVVAVALLAREGGLASETRAAMYEGGRVRGNMVPDVLTSQLRDETAADPRGLRTVRIATHHALRGRGLGSHLLDRIHAEFRETVGYFSVGFGATPRLLRFWRRAGYRAVHFSATRNDTSGEHSAIMLRPETAAGETLLDRHAAALRDRERDALSDAHRDVDPDVVRSVLAACPAPVTVDLTPIEWRTVVGASFGPGMYDAAPGAFRDLAMATLVGCRDAVRTPNAEPEDSPRDLRPREERLLVRKVLQGRPWAVVADELDYVSTAACMRALGEAAKPLVERYGSADALAERDRFTDG